MILPPAVDARIRVAPRQNPVRGGRARFTPAGRMVQSNPIARYPWADSGPGLNTEEGRGLIYPPTVANLHEHRSNLRSGIAPGVHSPPDEHEQGKGEVTHLKMPGARSGRPWGLASRLAPVWEESGPMARSSAVALARRYSLSFCKRRSASRKCAETRAWLWSYAGG
jgi:hypothetical protein